MTGYLLSVVLVQGDISQSSTAISLKQLFCLTPSNTNCNRHFTCCCCFYCCLNDEIIICLHNDLPTSITYMTAWMCICYFQNQCALCLWISNGIDSNEGIQNLTLHRLLAFSCNINVTRDLGIWGLKNNCPIQSPFMTSMELLLLLMIVYLRMGGGSLLSLNHFKYKNQAPLGGCVSTRLHMYVPETCLYSWEF